MGRIEFSKPHEGATLVKYSILLIFEREGNSVFVRDKAFDSHPLAVTSNDVTNHHILHVDVGGVRGTRIRREVFGQEFD